MIIHANPTHLAGTAVCGQVLALCDDDSVYAVYERDGEVTMRVRLEGTDADELERTLAEALSWVDGVGYPAVMRYVRDVIAREEGEEKVCA